MVKEEDMYGEYHNVTDELKKQESDFGYLLRKIYGDESLN